MTIIETNNYLIFSSDELSQQYKWKWRLTPYRPDDIPRDVDETDIDPRNHRRSVLTLITDDNQEIWELDKKECVEDGDKNTYIVNNNLRTIAENLVNNLRTLRGEAIDPNDKVISINFVTEDSSKYLPNNNVFIILRKENIYDYVSNFGGEPLVVDGFREIKNNRDEVDQFIRDRGETIENNHQGPQTWTLDLQPFTIQELNKWGDTFALMAVSSFFVNGQEVTNINVISNNQTIEVGDTIKISGVRIGPGQSRIVGQSLDIVHHFDNVEIVTKNNANNTGRDETPPPNNNRNRDRLQTILENALVNNEELRKMLGETDREWFLAVAEDDFLNNDNTINFPRIREFLQENGVDIPEHEPEIPNETPPREPTDVPPPHFPDNNDNNPETQPNIQELKEQTIQVIKQILAQKKYAIDNNDLNKKNWESLINGSNDINYIENLREEVLADIRGKRKEKIDNNVLFELVQKAQQIEKYEDLKKEIARIERFRGQANYNSLESEISILKRKLAEKNPEKYRNDNVEMIEEELKAKNVTKDELDTDAKEALERLESREISEPVEVNNAKNVISDNVASKSAENKLNSYLKEYKIAPDEVSKKIIKKKILNFINNANNFYKNAYQNRKSEVDRILGISSDYQPSSSKNNFPLVPTIIISGFVALLVGSAIIIRKRRINQKKK